MAKFSLIFISALIFEATCGISLPQGPHTAEIFGPTLSGNALPFQNFLNQFRFAGGQGRSASSSGSFSSSSSGAGSSSGSFSSSNAGSFLSDRNNAAFSQSNAGEVPQSVQPRDYRILIDVRSEDQTPGNTHTNADNSAFSISQSGSSSGSFSGSKSESGSYKFGNLPFHSGGNFAFSNSRSDSSSSAFNGGHSGSFSNGFARGHTGGSSAGSFANAGSAHLFNTLLPHVGLLPLQHIGLGGFNNANGFTGSTNSGSQSFSGALPDGTNFASSSSNANLNNPQTQNGGSLSSASNTGDSQIASITPQNGNGGSGVLQNIFPSNSGASLEGSVPGSQSQSNAFQNGNGGSGVLQNIFPSNSGASLEGSVPGSQSQSNAFQNGNGANFASSSSTASDGLQNLQLQGGASNAPTASENGGFAISTSESSGASITPESLPVQNQNEGTFAGTNPLSQNVANAGSLINNQGTGRTSDSLASNIFLNGGFDTTSQSASGSISNFAHSDDRLANNFYLQNAKDFQDHASFVPQHEPFKNNIFLNKGNVFSSSQSGSSSGSTFSQSQSVSSAPL